MIPNVAQAALSLSQSPELSLLAKATVVIAAGLLAARFATHARASIRHLWLAATFAAVLALPLAATSAPEIAIGVPAASIQATPAAPAPGAAPKTQALAATPAAAPAQADAAAPLAASVSWTVVGRGVWMVGSAILLAQLALVLWRLGRLRRTGLPWPEMRAPVRSLAADAGIDRAVDVVLHEEVSAPLTFGTRHPVIVLPPDARMWDDSDLRRALVHELEHVRRSDWAMQTAARAVCALWWFHPLVWVAWRRLSLEAERACDDGVIVREESMEYAEQLVSLAERLSAAHAQPTLGMANRSDLSARVTSLLDAGQRRGRAGATAVTGALVATALIVLTVAPLRAVARPGFGIWGFSTWGDSNLGASPSGPEPTAAVTPAASRPEQSRRQRGLDRELYEAAESGDTEGIVELIQAGADVNAAVDGDGSPLIGAVRSQRAHVVSLLLDRGANPNIGVDGDGSPLIVAAQSGRMDMVHLLLDRGANPNFGVEGDGSPLIAAAALGSVEMVTLLIDKGADVNLVVKGDENPLIQASAQGHLAVVQLLVARGADVNARVWAEGNRSRDGQRSEGEWRTPLLMARRERHMNVVAFLISAGARE